LFSGGDDGAGVGTPPAACRFFYKYALLVV
jgi:hypothetical protein